MFGRMVFAKSQSHSIVINLYFAEGCTVLLFVSLFIWVVLQTFCTQPIIAIVVLVGTLRVNFMSVGYRCCWTKAYIRVSIHILPLAFQFLSWHIHDPADKGNCSLFCRERLSWICLSVKLEINQNMALRVSLTARRNSAFVVYAFLIQSAPFLANHPQS